MESQAIPRLLALNHDVHDPPATFRIALTLLIMATYAHTEPIAITSRELRAEDRDSGARVQARIGYGDLRIAPHAAADTEILVIGCFTGIVDLNRNRCYRRRCLHICLPS